MAQTSTPGENEKNDKYYKNLKNNTQKTDLFKWRPVTFVKTDRNG